ncbi:class I SAM-dependent methyltransferase [Bacteroides sp. 224]|uniref:class I SAM-dependent methyltransferase n=1 Tax=Bacteroides sp. 224 TaxID=2302936 RepID=UPI0013D4A07C|nr:class I SAM-dependent methyltransferase [Bacteroides sp. 224]NDV65725.1 methyltransferase domain-containing protein [Bacteroides sp. 224]
MNKLILKSCPLCGSTQIKHSLTCMDFYASRERFEVFSCEACGFVFTQGIPSGDEINKYYESSDYISHSDTKKGLMNTLYHRVRKYMLNKKARMVVREAHRQSGRLLDIGTGTAYFPNAMMKKQGWEVEAVEKNADARAFAKEKFNIDVKSVDALNEFSPASFDVITLWHVMEHLENLHETWDRLFELLEAKGILIIAVPNQASYDAQKYGSDWAAYDVPRHLWHFTPGTMQQLASKHGFIMAERYPMPFDAFYISMLSERNKGSRFSFLKGMYVGTIAWFHALIKKERSSSMIYIFRKKTK